MMIGWIVVATVQTAAAQTQDLTWQEMVVAARELLPMTPPDPQWERVPDAQGIDLLHPLGPGRLLVGLVAIGADGVATPGPLQVWDSRTGDLVWTSPRPHGPGMVWDVLSSNPLVVAGHTPLAVVLQGIDASTGEATWSTSSESSTAVRTAESVLVWRRGQLEALSLASGESVWAVPMPDPAVVEHADGAIWVQNPEHVISIDAAWGAEDWRHPGSWSPEPAVDGLGVLLRSSRELRWLDAYGEQLWAWTSEDPIVDVVGVEGRATVLLKAADGDRVAVVSQGSVSGSLALKGRAASSLARTGGIVVVTTEDEIVAVSHSDASLAFRTPLPADFLGWGPSDRPDLAHGQPDVLHPHGEQIVVIRERAGIAAYEAANFQAGSRAWAHPHPELGADELSVGGRFVALNRAMASVTAGSAQEARIARRRIELDAAMDRAAHSITGNYYVRPFRRQAGQRGASGVSLVDLQNGQRADVVYAPLFGAVAREGLDLPSVAMDLDLGQLYVAGTTANPAMWIRGSLGSSTVPGMSVRSFTTHDLGFADEPDTLAALHGMFPKDAQVAPPSMDAAAPEPSQGLTPARCLEVGIIEAPRTDLIRRCLNAKILDVDVTAQGDVPLLLAAERNQLQTVRLLLEAGADPNKAQPHDRRTALERTTDPDVVAILTQSGGRARSEKEQQAGVKALLKLAGIRKPNTAFCFHHSSRGRTDVLDACLQTRKGSAVLRYVDPEMGHLLHVAAENGRVSHVRRLLDRGANPNVLDKKGRTPLDRIDAVGEGPAMLLAHEKAMRLLELAGGT